MAPLIKKLRNVTLLVVGTLLFLVVLFLAVSYMCEYRPEPREQIICNSGVGVCHDSVPSLNPNTASKPSPDHNLNQNQSSNRSLNRTHGAKPNRSQNSNVNEGFNTHFDSGSNPKANPHYLPDTLTILSWNIGYGGLGDNMDFFYDGGVEVRDSRERTEQNLNDIIATLKGVDADIMLLQEVDLSSHRTYGINEVELLRAAFAGHTLSFAYNYKARWVPIPLRSPIGRVGGGVVTLSRVSPIDSERINYPSSFPLPSRMFNLKRCLLSSRFLSSGGDTVLVGNTHNTAYDSGGMRAEEMLFLRDFIVANQQRGATQIIGGDWNQYPPSYIPAVSELSNPHFVPQVIDGELFDGLGQFVYDRNSASLRYLDKPYSAKSVKSLTDFFFATDQVRTLSIETLPLDFKSSDHNPVLIRVCL